MNFHFIGEACRDTPHDGFGCHYWTFIGPRLDLLNTSLSLSEQNRTCFLLNSCADLVASNQTEVVSGDRDCDPTDFLLALGEPLEKNIVALKEAKIAVERYAYRKRKVRAAASDCTEFTVLVNQSEFFQK